MQSILIVGVLALIAYVQGEKAWQWGIVLIYVLLSLVPIVGIILIAILPARPGDRALAHDGSTIVFARISSALSVLMVSLVSVVCYLGLLPGQVRESRLRVADFEECVLGETGPDEGINEKDKGIAATVYFFPLAYGFDEMPRPLVIDASLAEDIAASWSIVSVRSRSVDEDEADELRLASPSKIPNGKRVHWRGIDVRKCYKLRVLLHLRSGIVGAEHQELLRRNPNEVLTVTAYSYR